MSDPAEVAALLEQLWQDNRGVLLGRLDVVLAALEARAAGQAGAQQDAARQAHSLAGALGTYGRPGSPLMRQAEKALDSEGGDAGSAADLAAQVRALREALQA